jgi:histidine phosphotransferase ChpT
MSGTDSTLRLIELTSATLCHDISGLVGSLGDDADAMELQNPLLDRLTARLALRAAAWGPEGEPLTLAGMQSLARGLPKQVVVEASALERGTVFAASAGRIVLNLLLLAADSLPNGGTILLAGSADDLFVRIAGPAAAAWPAGMALCLANKTEALDALNAWSAPQMALTALLAHAAGIRLSVLFSPTEQNGPAILRLGG